MIEHLSITVGRWLAIVSFGALSVACTARLQAPPATPSDDAAANSKCSALEVKSLQPQMTTLEDPLMNGAGPGAWRGTSPLALCSFYQTYN